MRRLRRKIKRLMSTGYCTGMSGRCIREKHSLGTAAEINPSFNPEPEATAVSTRDCRPETAGASGFGLNKENLGDCVSVRNRRHVLNARYVPDSLGEYRKNELPPRGDRRC
jgi:hypothetical protein